MLIERTTSTEYHVPQQNLDQEWNNGRQIIVTDTVMIKQSHFEALMQGKWVK